MRRSTKPQQDRRRSSTPRRWRTSAWSGSTASTTSARSTTLRNVRRCRSCRRKRRSRRRKTLPRRPTSSRRRRRRHRPGQSTSLEINLSQQCPIIIHLIRQKGLKPLFETNFGFVAIHAILLPLKLVNFGTTVSLYP